MGAYLVDHPPARQQFLLPRRDDPSGVVVVHTAENLPDFVAFDGGAEAVANFIRTRTDAGSYHDLADSDSDINLVPYDAEAFHDATGSNPHSYGVSGATRADVWPLTPPEWRAGCVRNMARCAARYASWLKARSGIVIPAMRITRDQSSAGVPGFISHAERDPARRTDPGAGFPWSDFLGEFARLTAPTPGPSQEDDDMLPYLHASKYTGVTLVDAAGGTWIENPATVNELTAQGIRVVTMDVSEADARRFVEQRHAGADEAALQSERAQEAYLAAIAHVIAPETA
jgi:hypothetical protein